MRRGTEERSSAHFLGLTKKRKMPSERKQFSSFPLKKKGEQKKNNAGINTAIAHLVYRQPITGDITSSKNNANVQSTFAS